MKQRWYPTTLTVLVCALFGVAGCSSYQHYEASKPDAVKTTESRLTDAGFTKIQIDNSTPEQAGLAATLPTYELRQYPVSSGVIYWYYDPDFCSCLFEGNEEAFESYQMTQRQQHDIEQYAAESQDAQVAALNGINGTMFPPPMWIGGYHSYYGGGFFRGGDGGHVSGGGGGGHSGGGGGGGHGFGGGHLGGHMGGHMGGGHR